MENEVPKPLEPSLTSELASKKNERRMVLVSCPLAKYCFLLFLFFVIVRRTTMNTSLKCNLKILNNLLPPTFN